MNLIRKTEAQAEYFYRELDPLKMNQRKWLIWER